MKPISECGDDLTVTKLRQLLERLEAQDVGNLPIRVNMWLDWFDRDGEFNCVSVSDTGKEVVIGL